MSDFNLVQVLRNIASNHSTEPCSTPEGIAADLIEQQQAKIAELEKSERTAWSTLIAIADKLGIDTEEARKLKDGKPSDVFVDYFNLVCGKNEQLAATVERLRIACRLGIDMFVANDINVPNTIETMQDAIDATPQQNLNALKREVGVKMFLDGCYYGSQYAEKYWGEAALEYANKIYPSDDKCEHNWVSAKNEVVKNGFLCTNCNAICSHVTIPNGKE